jgi:hypothetical protein
MQNSVNGTWWSQLILTLTSSEIYPVYRMWLVYLTFMYEVHSKDLGFKFGDIEDHGNTLMLFWVRKSMEPRWNISLCRSITLSICWLYNIVSIAYSIQTKEMQNSASRAWWSQLILTLTSSEIYPVYRIWLLFFTFMFSILYAYISNPLLT